MVKRDFKGVFIPAHVWTDVNLTPVEMKLYIEVNSLDKGTGAFASNAHYAEILSRTIRQVQIIIKSLIEKKYIRTEGDGKGRRLFNTHEVTFVVDSNHEENFTPTMKKTSPVGKQVDCSTGSSNTTTTLEPSTPPTERSKPTDNYLFLLKLYKSLYLREFGTSPILNNHAMQRKMIQRFSTEMTQTQATAILFAHFDWRGIDGQRYTEFDRIKNAGFPLSWISNGVNNYITYLKTTVKVDFDSEEELKPVVEGWLQELSK